MQVEDTSLRMCSPSACSMLEGAAACIALSEGMLHDVPDACGQVWMWAVFLLACLVPAALIPLQLALSVGLWSQASAMRVAAETVQRALHAPVSAAAVAGS